MMQRGQSGKWIHRCRLPLLALLLLISGARAVQAQSESANSPVDPDHFGPELKTLIVAQQGAIRSGDADAVIVYSRALALASLHELARLAPNDVQCRKALASLPSSDRMVHNLPTALLLLRAELNSGEKSDAAELEREIVTTHPDGADLRVRLSKTLADSSDLDGAVREATKAAELNPNSVEAQIALGMAWWALNEFGYNENSLRAFTAAQRLDPNGYAGNLSLGLVESQYHDFAPAGDHLRAAARADPSAPAPWYQLGMNAYEQDRLAKGEQALQKYLALAKGQGGAKAAQIRLALVTLDAIADEQGLSADPAHAPTEAALQKQIGPQTDTMAFSPDAARGAMEAPSRGTQEAQPEHTAKSSRATPQEMRELAANSLNDWGTALARKQEYAAAVLPFRYAAVEDPTLDPVMRNLGFSAFMSGGYAESEQALLKVLALHPDDLTARAWLGMAQFENGEYANAAGSFQALGPALSSRPLMEATAAAAFARTGDRDRAAAALAKIDASASDPPAAARAATAALDLGNRDRAATLAQAALAQNPQPAEAWRVIGDIDLETRQSRDAIHAFEESARASSNRPEELAEAQALLAAAMIQDGRSTEATAIRRAVLRANPDLVQRLRSRGALLMKSGAAHAARESLAAAMALAPDDTQLKRDFESAVRQSSQQISVQ